MELLLQVQKKKRVHENHGQNKDVTSQHTLTSVNHTESHDLKEIGSCDQNVVATHPDLNSHDIPIDTAVNEPLPSQVAN